METDRIRMDTDSDIPDNSISVFFQFSSLRMEMVRIRTDTNLDILDNYFSISLPFPSLVPTTARNRILNATSLDACNLSKKVKCQRNQEEMKHQ